MISKSSIYSKRENEKGERERVTSLVSFERERERENETFIPRSTRSNSCWRRLIFFSFFLPNCLSLDGQNFRFFLTKYSQNITLSFERNNITQKTNHHGRLRQEDHYHDESGKRTARCPRRGRKTDENRLRLDRVRAVLENRRLGRRRRLVTD